MNLKLRSAREKLGLTQPEVADKAKISIRAYQNYEYDKKEPKVRTANRIARAVKSTSEKLWGFNDATPNKAKKPDGNQAE